MTLPPLGVDEFAALMAPLWQCQAPPNLAVAVSGGGDSMALALLLNQWVKLFGGKVTALTVDHGLRAEARAEAEQVATWMKAQHIEHHILSWQGVKPTTRLQERAREARYALLAAWCRERKMSALVLGHHADDQVETCFMRLLRGSGMYGLGGMRSARCQDDLLLLRPLLSVPHQRLIATLSALGQSYITDPSNSNPRYMRTRLRAVLSQLDAKHALHHTLLTLSQEAQALYATRATLLHPFVEHFSEVHGGGVVSIERAPLATLPLEEQCFVLRSFLRQVSGERYPPPEVILKRLAEKVCDVTFHKAFTLQGCVVELRRRRIWGGREERSIGAPLDLSKGGRFLWDGRFAVHVVSPLGLSLRPLGNEAYGWYRVAEELDVPPFPRRFLRVLPSLWQGDKCLTVWDGSYRARAAFEQYGLSLSFALPWPEGLAPNPCFAS